MKDREFLMWIHERLEYIHGERAIIDYMHKLRAIIRGTPADKETPNVYSGNSLDELRNSLSEYAKSPTEQLVSERAAWNRVKP